MRGPAIKDYEIIKKRIHRLIMACPAERRQELIVGFIELLPNTAAQLERATDVALCPVCNFEQKLDEICEEHGVYKITPRR